MATELLVIEDEIEIRDMLVMLLEQSGFRVRTTGRAEDALLLLQQQVPDLILLDWMLPGMSGVEFARRIKRDELAQAVPIIMLTARGEEEDKIRGLDVGADDYLSKPFSPKELLARIRALLRRVAPHKSDESIEVQQLRLDPVTHRVTVNELPVELGPTEFRLLHFFMSHQERVYSRGQLLDNVWGANVYVEERTVDVHIRRLRKALESHQREHLIQTVRGTGYRFSGQS